eukprot:3242879-Pyramimonas_sp.AAC.1
MRQRRPGQRFVVPPKAPAAQARASTPPRRVLRGLTGSSTAGSSGTDRMRQRHPGECFVAP